MELMADSKLKRQSTTSANACTYINVMRNMSVGCDCMRSSKATKPTIRRYRHSCFTDILAIDQACVDLVFSHTSDNHDLLRECKGGTQFKTAHRNGEKEKWAIQQYELIEIL